MEKIIPKQLERSEPPLVRVVLFGPESTGKTTLSRQLSEHYRAPWVAEFARDFLQRKWDAQKEVCSEADLIDIAIGQVESENQAAEQADPLLICDTDVLETLAYSYWYFGSKADERLEESARQAEYDLYLLTYIDTPWTPDDLRDQPVARPELFAHFKNGTIALLTCKVILCVSMGASAAVERGRRRFLEVEEQQEQSVRFLPWPIVEGVVSVVVPLRGGPICEAGTLVRAVERGLRRCAGARAHGRSRPARR